MKAVRSCGECGEGEEGGEEEGMDE